MRSRRHFLRDTARGLGALGAAAVMPASAQDWAERLGLRRVPRLSGGFVGQAHQRGHRLRNLGELPAPSETRRAAVAIVGSGIAGLAAARALRQAGIDDYRLFELEDETGGNSRGGELGGFDCPWGAHYLPLPGPHAGEVASLLDEYGLRSLRDGQVQYDEMQLCHSPQERLFIDGHWQEGLVPDPGTDALLKAQYRRFAEQVRQLQQPRAFTIPTSASAWTAKLTALDRMSFSQWLDQQGLTAPALRWYLDYCCRDDYGAGSARVSAWAGLHYFASRHGFTPPGEEGEAELDLTWPEGNAWLARRLAAPHLDRCHTASLALRATETRSGVLLDVLDLRSGKQVRWELQRLILATPLFVSLRLLTEPPRALREATAAMVHAPWLVANILIDRPLREHRHQAPLSWDNVIHGGQGLGYVNAMHQSTRPYAGATVLTYYRALGDDAGDGRRQLLARSWEQWSEAVFADLEPAHPDLRDKARRIDIMRYGHAMAVPVPGLRSSAALAALRQPQGRIALAHGDLSAYSVFEEALHWGLHAGHAVARGLGR